MRSPITAALLLLIAMSASAQNARSVVATSGLDTNTCIVGAPCRSFSRAMSVTNAGGEIIALSSGGYGPFEIDRAVSVIAAPGVHAAISVPVDGFGIAITTVAPVSIRGIVFTSAPGAAAIYSAAGPNITVDRCDVNGGSLGIGFFASMLSTGTFVISDTVVRNTTAAGFEFGTAGALVRTRAESSGSFGYWVIDGGLVTAVDAIAVGGSGIGFYVSSNTAPAAADLDRCLSANNAVGVSVNGPNLSTATLRITDCMITENSIYGLSQAGNSVLGSLNNNLVAGNLTADTTGTITVVAPH